MSSAPPGQGIDRILVRGPNWLGDVVMATPGLQALRNHFPSSRIVLLLPRSLAPLLEGSPLCDEVWPLESREGGARGWWRDARRIRAGRFDLGLVIPESISSALLMRLGRVAQTVGFARDPLRRCLLHETLDAPEEWGARRMVSRERFVLELMASVGIPAAPVALQLCVDAEEEARLERALREAGTSLQRLAEQPPIVLAPGAGYGDAKCWPAESFATLGDRLVEEGHAVVLLGAPGESARIAAVREAMRTTPLVLDGTIDVGALKALMQRAHALVANDAGARHVAAAFDVPSVLFFGPTAVEKTADNLGRARILESDHDCRPCYKRQCPIDHRCLRSIHESEAYAALRDATGAAREASAHEASPPSIEGTP